MGMLSLTDGNEKKIRERARARQGSCSPGYEVLLQWHCKLQEVVPTVGCVLTVCVKIKWSSTSAAVGKKTCGVKRVHSSPETLVKNKTETLCAAEVLSAL